MQKRTWIDGLLLCIIIGALLVAVGGVYQYVQQPKGLIVRWSTEYEVEILGFHLYRAPCAEADCAPAQTAYSRLTAQPIPASPDPIIGADYEYFDETVTAGLYAYVIETLYLDGDSDRSAPPLLLQLP